MGYLRAGSGFDFGEDRFREVGVGSDVLDIVEVFEGIEKDHRVVTRGVSKISDGMVVRLPESGTGG